MTLETSALLDVSFGCALLCHNDINSIHSSLDFPKFKAAELGCGPLPMANPVNRGQRTMGSKELIRIMSIVCLSLLLLLFLSSSFLSRAGEELSYDPLRVNPHLSLEVVWYLYYVFW